MQETVLVPMVCNIIGFLLLFYFKNASESRQSDTILSSACACVSSRYSGTTENPTTCMGLYNL